MIFSERRSNQLKAVIGALYIVMGLCAPFLALATVSVASFIEPSNEVARVTFFTFSGIVSVLVGVAIMSFRTVPGKSTVR